MKTEERQGFTFNPVLLREIKERVRSPRATVILVIYLTVLSAILYFVYRFTIFQTIRMSFSPFAQFAAPGIGRILFETLLLLLLILVAFIAPGIAAGSISSERERQTLQLLQVTLLRPRSIVLGKIQASLAFLLLLLVATIPLFVIPLTLGGVSLGDVLRGGAVILAVSILISSIATYVSASIRRTQFATVAAYGLVLLYFTGTLFTWAAEEIGTSGVSGGFGRSPAMSTYLNPITALATAVGTPVGGQTGASPLSGIASAVDNNSNFIPAPSTPGSSSSFSPSSLQAKRSWVWLTHIAIAAIFSAIFIGLASHRLRAPVPRFVIGRFKE